MSDDEILQGFENRTFAHAQWNHAAHLHVARGYLPRQARREWIPPDLKPLR